MATLKLTELADVCGFRDWLRTAGRLGVSLNMAGTVIGFGDDTSADGYTLHLDNLDVLRAVVAAIEGTSKRVWCDEATDLACVLADRLGLDIEALNWVSCMTTALAILEPGIEQPGRPSALVLRAASTVRDAQHIAAEFDRPLRKVALSAVLQDALWRPIQQRGLLLDTVMLATKTDAALDERAARKSAYGIDLTEDSDAVYGWLARRGMQILDKEGAPSLSRDDFGRALIPEDALDAWKIFRGARSLKSTLGKLVEFTRYEVDGRVYPTVVARSGTKTGRAKTLRPGYHNLNRSLRGLIIARPGYTLVSLDIDRAEPSVAAALSGDRVLAAALLVSDPYEERAVAHYGEAARGNGDLRDRFKKCLLAAFYQQGPSSLAADLSISVEEAKTIQQELRRAWPTLFAWIDGVLKAARRQERLTTISGRFLPIPERGDEFKAVNWVLQGSASDLFCDAVARVAAELGASSLFLGIHDELVVEVPDRDIPFALEALERGMTTTINGVRVGGTAKVLGGRWGK
ncbi:hypothetical protein RCH23_002116 [Cryobacterium sp. CAN_C3]|uniref:DNA polymerase n=1 Tax=unclassified Cryobacterium TaxID=2649013 RepID=UPI0018CB9CF5|nr:DNA polymerase [Cryobacterium sp. CAN_C3]MEC5154731.1 hypothetical protein [Cryobacterium sp. CAN_C3]